MSRPVDVSNLPSRLPDDNRRAGRNEAEMFALKSQVDLLEWLRTLERRVEQLENRLSRIFVDGG